MSGVLHGMFLGAKASDPFYNDTVLLLRANANDTFTDVSKNGYSITANGTVSSTATAKFGGRSASFNGSSQFLSLADNDDWDFTGDFTVESWVYLNSVNQNGTIVSQYAGAGSIGFNFQFRSDFGGSYIVSSGDTIQIGRGAINTGNTWVHVAVSRSGTNLRMFFDGVQQGETVTDSTSFSGSTVPLTIGRLPSFNVHYLNGFLQDLRLTKAARYTSNFTPPDNLL